MAKYNPQKHNRKSIRLKGYDYSQAGLYFITMCTQNRANLFGEIQNGEMILNEAGGMVEKEWLKLPKRFTNIKLHEYITMPNHFHAILEIVGATLVVVPEPSRMGKPQGFPPTVKPKTVGDMIGAFKSITTVEYIRGVKNLDWEPFYRRLWQRNYWEHIIRDEQSYHRISRYIINNPKSWEDDKLNK